MTVAQTLDAVSPDRSFRARVEELVARHQRLWREAAEGVPNLGPRCGRWRRFRTARATRRMILELAEETETHPDGERLQNEWRRDIRQRLQRFGEQRLGWPAGYRSLLFGDDFYATTVAFVRRARAFDDRLAMDDVGQAMRNLWIVNSLQMLFGAPVELTPSAFAYSMLYPYTDNLLDDPSLAIELKEGMNERLGRWLRGRRAVPCGSRERRIRELIAIIESDYPRGRFESVYQSLLAIHEGQIGSLRLQHGQGAPDRETVLRVQIEKGGTSVLADGYLVRGWLEADQEDFCFGYGAFLQLLDDLQDAAADREVGHATLFSVDLGRVPLDRLVGKLWSYMRRVVDGAASLRGADFDDRKDLILRNCTFLMMSAIAEHPELVSRGFRRSLERRWPLGFGAMRSLRGLAQRRFRQVRDVLQRRKRAESLWDLVT